MTSPCHRVTSLLRRLPPSLNSARLNCQLQSFRAGSMTSCPFFRSDTNSDHSLFLGCGSTASWKPKNVTTISLSNIVGRFPKELQKLRGGDEPSGCDGRVRNRK